MEQKRNGKRPQSIFILHFAVNSLLYLCMRHKLTCLFLPMGMEKTASEAKFNPSPAKSV